MNQQLIVFITVVEKKNFSRAAEKLHMTQPAVSQYIKSLERNYGVKLLDRNNKAVHLTKAGEIVYFHAKEITSLYQKMNHLIDDLTNRASGPLSIGASYTFGEYVLPRLIAKLRVKFPDIQPKITIGNSNDIADLVLRHQLDVGIIEGAIKNRELFVEAFAEDEIHVVASAKHPFAKDDKEVNLDHLRNEMWIVREQGSGTREAAEKVFQAIGLQPNHLMEFGSTQLIKESVEAGLGITLLSHLAVQKEQSMNVLKIIPVQATPFKREFSVVLGTSFKTKAVEVFIELLKEYPKLSALFVD